MTREDRKGMPERRQIHADRGKVQVKLTPIRQTAKPTRFTMHSVAKPAHRAAAAMSLARVAASRASFARGAGALALGATAVRPSSVVVGSLLVGLPVKARSFATAPTPPKTTVFDSLDSFARRHIGPRDNEIPKMLSKLGMSSLEELTDKAVPKSVLNPGQTSLGAPVAEHDLLAQLKEIASKNQVFRSYIGMGYYGTVTPPVILRNIMENPGWYTQYTPYQAEIAQGRLESLINYQTMVSDLTGLPISNASLLDEGTAAGEAMLVCFSHSNRKRKTFLVDEACHPQTIACVKTRAEGFGIDVVVAPQEKFEFGPAGKSDVMGILISVSFIRVSSGKQLFINRKLFFCRFCSSLVGCASTDLVPQHLRHRRRLRRSRFPRSRSRCSCRLRHGSPCSHFD